ncbi:MAG: hypothetical protein HYU66_23855 [Armatimonadetes bacterium]|nr:hypothetical protein [Armatimonadota bacterium]
MTLGLFGVLVVALLLGAAGQMLMKQSLNAYKAVHGDELTGFGMLLHALFTPGVLAGLSCYVVSTFLYMILLWKMPVSLLYPMVALNYVFVTILARLFLHEQVPVARLGGLALILAGVYIYAVHGQVPAAPGAEQPVPVVDPAGAPAP